MRRATRSARTSGVVRVVVEPVRRGAKEIRAGSPRPETELIPYPFAQSLLPRHTTSGTFAQDPALHVASRDTEESAADSRHILPIRLQLLDRHVLVTSAMTTRVSGGKPTSKRPGRGLTAFAPDMIDAP